MNVVELKCFGVRAGDGNAALVVRGDRSDETARQTFATAQRKPACVFISDDEVPTLDYYYQHMRSPLCVHATLAAAKVLLNGQPGPVTVRTAMRGQELQLSLRDGLAYVALSKQPVPDVTIPADLPARLIAVAAGMAAVSAAELKLVSPPAIASIGSPKLLLEVADPATLHALQPDLAAIAAWGKANGVSGIYAWCRRPDGGLEGRNFNHLDPALEDAATGVAAGTLTAFLGHAIKLYQGSNMDQPCLLHTALDGESILVGGNAEFV
jgi:PhzF family phenazine biosynthesis protein